MSRDGADQLLQVRCAVYNGTLGAGFGHRFDRIARALPRKTHAIHQPPRQQPIGYHIACAAIHRGGNAHYWAPPAQIRKCGLPAYGSYLGCLTAKRTFGQGCRIRGLGSHSSASLAIRSHVVRSFWLRRRSVRSHKTLTWCRKAASARLLVGTAW